MRHSLWVCLLLLAGCFAWAVFQMLEDGRERRAAEERARASVLDIMLAQERHRQDAATDGPEAPLFASLEELTASGALRGFECIESDGVGERFRRDEYVFQLRLVPGQRGLEGLPRLGQRYELWAWPERPELAALLLYYGSSAGYLIQGENQEVVGPQANPPSDNPLKVLQRNERSKARWTILQNIREEESPAVAPG